MKRFFAMIVLAACAFSAFALPSVDAVQAEVNRGNYAQAETMMREVVAGRPGSAKAHYIYAEILAHNKRFDQAAEEAAQASKIDPTLQFTQPEKFRAFQQLLDRERAAPKRVMSTDRADRAAAPVVHEAAPREQGSGIPGWIWGLGGAAAGLIVWRLLSARSSPAATGSFMPGAPARPSFNAAGPFTPGASPGPSFGGGYGPSYAPPPTPGSGMLGTGLAVAGGLAAGMMAEKLLDGHRDSGSGLSEGSRSDGLVPGMFDNTPVDDSAARDLEQRPVDFGSGGDDWGGDDGGGSMGGSDDW